MLKSKCQCSEYLSGCPGHISPVGVMPIKIMIYNHQNSSSLEIPVLFYKHVCEGEYITRACSHDVKGECLHDDF